MRFLEHEVKMTTLAHCASLMINVPVRTHTRISYLLTWSCCLLFLDFVICSGSSWFHVRDSCHLSGFLSASGNTYNQPCRFHPHNAAECLGACEN